MSRNARSNENYYFYKIPLPCYDFDKNYKNDFMSLKWRNENCKVCEHCEFCEYYKNL